MKSIALACCGVYLLLNAHPVWGVICIVIAIISEH